MTKNVSVGGRKPESALKLSQNEVARRYKKYSDSREELDMLLQESYPEKTAKELSDLKSQLMNTAEEIRLIYETENPLLNIKKKTDKGLYTAELCRGYLDQSLAAVNQMCSKLGLAISLSDEGKSAYEIFTKEYFDAMEPSDLTKSIKNELVDLTTDMQNGWLANFFAGILDRIKILEEIYMIDPQIAPGEDMIDMIVDTRKQLKLIEAFFTNDRLQAIPAEEERRAKSPGRPPKPIAFTTKRLEAEMIDAHKHYEQIALQDGARVKTPSEIFASEGETVMNAIGRLALSPMEKAMSDRYKAKNALEDLLTQEDKAPSLTEKGERIGRKAKTKEEKAQELRDVIDACNMVIEEENRKAEEEGGMYLVKHQLLGLKGERRDIRYGLKRKSLDPNISIDAAKENGENKDSLTMRERQVELDKEIDQLTKMIGSVNRAQAKKAKEAQEDQETA